MADGRHLGFPKVGNYNRRYSLEANMQIRAKFDADQTTHCGDMAIFRFFKTAAVSHIGFVIGVL